MRAAAYHYLAETWAPRRHRPIQPGSLSRAAGRGRHAKAPRRGRPGRELPAVARRVLALLSSTSPAA
jgi:hypothetical protein